MSQGDSTRDWSELTGDELLEVLGALANPHRMRILAALADGREYVSQLAREIGMSRPLLHMHLQKLQAAGLVSGSLELGEEGKAMKYFEIAPFSVTLNQEAIAAAARSLAREGDQRSAAAEEQEGGEA